MFHPCGEITQDGNCLLCHSSGGPAGDIPNSHIPVSSPNPNNIYVDQSSTGNSNTNAAYVAAAGAVPPGAKVIVYDVKSVSTWDDSGVKRPQIVFKFKLGDGVNFTDVVFPNPTAATELIPNFVGSPSAYFAFAVPQDCGGDPLCRPPGRPTPADFNATGSAYIRNVWNGSGTCSNVPASATTTPTGAGNLTGPDASGYYTLQLKCVVIPANASMLTGGIGYTYNLGTVNASDSTLNFINNNQPLTQINLPAYPYTPNDPNGGKGGKGGLIVPALDVWKVATGYTGRRADPTNGQQKPAAVTEKCDACHVALGVGPDLHASERTYAANTPNSEHSPYVTEGTNYGAGFNFNPLTGASTEAASTTLVISPIVAACSACHDSPAAIDHMQTNGGSFWRPRAEALNDT